MRNSKFYGESEALDCDVKDYCLTHLSEEACLKRTALIIPYFSKGGKPPMVNKKNDLTYHLVGSDASWGGNILFENLYFAEFRNEYTYCGTE